MNHFEQFTKMLEEAEIAFEENEHGDTKSIEIDEFHAIVRFYFFQGRLTLIEADSIPMEDE